SLLLVLACAPAARAHQSSVAYSEIVVDGRDIDYTIQIASTDLYEAIGVDKDRPVTRDEVERGRARLFRYLAEHLHAADGERPCEPAPTSSADLSFIDKGDTFFAA